jgi:hypothetical protein
MNHNIIFIVLLKHWEKIAQVLQMDTKLQRKELFKLWMQINGDHSSIKTEYVQNSVIGIYR